MSLATSFFLIIVPSILINRTLGRGCRHWNLGGWRVTFMRGSFKQGNRHYIYTMGNHKNLYLSIDPETSQKRNCLRCEKLFLSEHIGNRLCPKCEKRS